MNDRAGFFAGCADILTDMCVYYAVAGILIMSNRGWGLHLFWLLLCPAVCALFFALLLKKPRSVPLLTAVTGVLFAATLAVFLLASATPPKFGYIFVLSVGAGMGVGLPLYYALHRPLIHKHLTRLDVLIMTLFALLLCRQALGIDTATVALMVIVLLMDAAAAVGLRMTEGGGDSRNAFKASMVALGGALLVFLLIALLVALFSRSGSVVDGILHGIGVFLAAIGSGIERFFRWLTALFAPKEQFEALQLEGELPSLAGAELESGDLSLSVNTTAVGIALCVLILAAAAALALFMRKKTLSQGTKVPIAASNPIVRKSGGAIGLLWQKLWAAIRFRYTAFRLRNTPGGLLVILERMGKRRHSTRGQGESMRAYIARMDKTGGLTPLADALDAEYYGGRQRTISARQCRELRKHMRKAVLHG